MSAPTTLEAVRLLAELVELDRQMRLRRTPLTFAQKQRRAQIAQDLHRWALARQRWSGSGAQRRDPRAGNVRVRVQMVGDPRPLELKSDSLAVGGMSLDLPFEPRLGDRLHLRLVPPCGDEPFEVEAEVVWINVAKHRAGVQFTSLSDEARALLERLIFSDLVHSGEPL